MPFFCEMTDDQVDRVCDALDPQADFLTRTYARHLGRGHGRGEQEALGHVRAQVEQHLALLLVFHPLHEHPEVEGLGHGDHRGEERAVARVRRPKVVAVVLALLVVLSGFTATASVYLTGHSGAKSVWEDTAP